MTKQLILLIHNTPLISAVVAWALAQILKALHSKFVLKTFSKERFVGPGGMPSSHSATVSALAVAVARTEGIGSTMFALSFALAIVVMYDAVSVRYQAGQHAKALNIIIQQMFDGNKNDEEKFQLFKEVLGHTPLQVFVGVVLGILVGAFMPILG